MTSTLQRFSTWGVRALTLLSLGCLAVVMAAQRLQPNKSAAARLAPPQEPTPIPTRARLLLAVKKPPPLQPDFHQQLPHNLSWLFKNRAPRIYLEQVATMHEQPQALVDWAEVPGGAAQRFCGCFSKPGAQVRVGVALRAHTGSCAGCRPRPGLRPVKRPLGGAGWGKGPGAGRAWGLC